MHNTVHKDLDSDYIPMTIFSNVLSKLTWKFIYFQAKVKEK